MSRKRSLIVIIVVSISSTCGRVPLWWWSCSWVLSSDGILTSLGESWEINWEKMWRHSCLRSCWTKSKWAGSDPPCCSKLLVVRTYWFELIKNSKFSEQCIDLRNPMKDTLENGALDSPDKSVSRLGGAVVAGWYPDVASSSKCSSGGGDKGVLICGLWNVTSMGVDMDNARVLGER